MRQTARLHPSISLHYNSLHCNFSFSFIGVSTLMRWQSSFHMLFVVYMTIEEEVEGMDVYYKSPLQRGPFLCSIYWEDLY